MRLEAFVGDFEQFRLKPKSEKMMLIVQQNHPCIQYSIRRDVYPAVPEQRFSPIL